MGIRTAPGRAGARVAPQNVSLTHFGPVRVAAGLAIALALAGIPCAAQVTITVDSTVTFQTMTGWEATAWADHETIPTSPEFSPAFLKYRAALLDSVVHRCGLDRIRLEVRSGVETDVDWWTQYQTGQVPYATWRSRRYATVNDNADPFLLDAAGFKPTELDSTIERLVLPLQQRLVARGERLFVNLNCVAFTGQIGAGLEYVHDDPEEYAEFMEAIFLHLDARYGWVPDAVEPILEPDNVAQWNGTRLGQAIVATASRLAGHGYHPTFIAPSTTNMANAITYFDAMAQVVGALGPMSELSYHRYGGVSDPTLQGIAQRAVQYGLGTSMLEWWSAGNGYATLHHDLELGRNSSWQQGVFGGTTGPGDGTSLCWIDAADPQHPVVHLNEKTRFTRQYFLFVRSGAVRVGAASNGPAFAPLAWVNPSGKFAVVVKATAGGVVAVHGLPAGRYGIKYATAAAYDVDLPDQSVTAGNPVTASMPAAGVMTVYGKDSTTAVGDGRGGDPARTATAKPPLVRVTQVAPNPFNPVATVAFALARAGEVRVQMLDSAGRGVREMDLGRLAIGERRFTWDGRDGRGRPLPSGVYYCRVSVEGAADVVKLVLVR